MNKIYLILLILVSSISVSSQVGINTNHPFGNFMIDANGDNVSSTPTAAQLKNDVVMQTFSNEAQLGIAGIPVDGAQLHLGDTHKALGLNRVKLNTSFDLTTVPDPTDALVVYNQTTTTLEDGVYFFSDDQWGRMVTNRFAGSFINFLNLSTNVATTPITPAQLTAETYSVGAEIQFVTRENGNITLLEDGAYSFNMHLTGYVPNGTSQFTSYYVFLVNATTNTVVDSYTIVLKPFTNAPQTASVFLNANFNKNDNVKIYICHNSGSDRAWNLRGSTAGSMDLIRSYMVFWKL